MDQITKDIVFYDASGGGVTFSGGEPLMQPEFLLELLDACAKLDIHRAVDTTGYADPEILSRVSEYTDLFLYDLKHMDAERHRAYTGVTNEIILNNIKLLAEKSARLNVRIPLIPGINNDAENIEATGRFISLLPGVRHVSLLPFHNSAKAKYSRMGIHCFSNNVPALSEPEIATIAECLEKFGLVVKIGG
jgi:pyruvate formate lyase activating enzyme